MIRNLDSIVRDAERAARSAFADATEGKMEPLAWLAVVQSHASNLDDLAATERLHREFTEAELNDDDVSEAIIAWVEDGTQPLHAMLWHEACVSGVDPIEQRDVADAIWDACERIAPGKNLKVLRESIAAVRRAIAEAKRDEPHPSLSSAQRNPGMCGKELGQ